MALTCQGIKFKMIPNVKASVVKEQQTNRNIFNDYYKDLCRWNATVPVHSVRAHLSQNILDFYGDRIQLDEWKPIIKALGSDRSLRFIAIRCTTTSTITESASTVVKARNCTTRPAILTRYIMKMLADALTECLSANTVLTCLELEGFPLSLEYIEEIVRGINNCESLRKISFHRSLINDEGLAIICRSVKHRAKIVSLDISGCGITGIGAQSLISIIKYQRVLMSRDAWQQSLRDQHAEEQPTPGLQRITLNRNPMFGDAGAMALIEELDEHVWFKALDLQDCGLSDIAGKAILKMIQSNIWIEIVDVRANQDLSTDITSNIMHQLQINNAQKVIQYDWLSIEIDTKRPPSQQKKGCCPPRARSQKPIREAKSTSTENHVTPGYAKPRPGPRVSGMYATSGIPRAEQYKLMIPPYLASIPERSPVQQADGDKEQIDRLTEQVESVTSSMVTILQTLNDEKKKREEAESELLRIRRQQEGSIILSHETVEDIEEAFDSFAKFLQTVRESGLVPRIVETMNKREKLSSDRDSPEVEVKQRNKTYRPTSEKISKVPNPISQVSDAAQNNINVNVKPINSKSSHRSTSKRHDIAKNRPSTASSTESRASLILQQMTSTADAEMVPSTRKLRKKRTKRDKERMEGMRVMSDCYRGVSDQPEIMQRQEIS